MALIYRYRTFDEGVEFPVKETISKVMLCTMFDQDLDQTVHIFFDSEHLTTLESPESYFRPENHGKYTAVFEKAEKEAMTNLLLASVTKRLVTAKYYETENLVAKGLEGDKSDFATFYMQGFTGNKLAVPLNTDITKELLCSIFDKRLDLKVTVFYQGDKLITFKKDDLDKSFVTEKPGFYRVEFSNSKLKKHKEPEDLGLDRLVKMLPQYPIIAKKRQGPPEIFDREDEMPMGDLLEDVDDSQPCSSNQKASKSRKQVENEEEVEESKEDKSQRKNSESNDWEIVGSDDSHEE